MYIEGPMKNFYNSIEHNNNNRTKETSLGKFFSKSNILFAFICRRPKARWPSVIMHWFSDLCYTLLWWHCQYLHNIMQMIQCYRIVYNQSNYTISDEQYHHIMCRKSKRVDYHPTTIALSYIFFKMSDVFWTAQ